MTTLRSLTRNQDFTSKSKRVEGKKHISMCGDCILHPSTNASMPPHFLVILRTGISSGMTSRRGSLTETPVSVDSNLLCSGGWPASRIRLPCNDAPRPQDLHVHRDVSKTARVATQKLAYSLCIPSAYSAIWKPSSNISKRRKRIHR